MLFKGVVLETRRVTYLEGPFVLVGWLLRCGAVRFPPR